jgi:hypothetical protein
LLPQLARNAGDLYEMLQESVLTDMALDQMIALANVAVTVEPEDIRFGVIDDTCTQPWVTPDGAQVLVPLRDRMREVRDYIFHADVSPAASEDATPRPVPSPTPEVAVVSVLNGTTRAGLAGSTADQLRDRGVTVANVGNADSQDYASSVVVLNRDKPRTLERILAVLELPETAVVQGQNPGAAYDIVVVLGQDFEASSGP